MRYVPIYLRQGLVVSSLMSGTFLLLCLPLLGSSWRIGEDELVTLRHTFFARLFLDRVVVGLGSGDSGASQSACPSSSYWFRMRCSSLCLNLKNMFSFLMRKRISPLHTAILALAALRNGRPRMSSIPRSPSISMTTKSVRTKESRTRTRRFLAIPSGYRIVESASCTHMYVGERARYKSFSYITMGIMLTLAPRL